MKRQIIIKRKRALYNFISLLKHYMKNALHKFILLLFLLVIPTSSALACGSVSDKDKMEQTACNKDDNTSKKIACCSTDSDADKSCAGSCDSASCHCPSTPNTPVFSNVFYITHANHYQILVNDWAYVQPAPRAVYLSIWQLPKIS